VALTAGTTAAFEPVERRVSAMGTWLEVRADGADRTRAVAASEIAVETVEGADARLSTWRRGGELDRLNRASVGRWVGLSPALARELADARDLERLTSGAFSPMVGPLVAAWGLRTGGRLPDAGEIRRALARCAPDGLELDGLRARRTREGVEVEEGAFGKGAGLRDAITSLTEYPDVCVSLDLGGQVALSDGCGTVDVELASPTRRDRRPVALLRVGGGSSVATSGNSERAVTVAGRPIGHLLDPRTGRPAEVPGSVSVLAADPLAADALATALAVMGADAPAWLLAHPGVEAVLAEEREGRVELRVTSGLVGRVAGLVPGVEIRGLGAAAAGERRRNAGSRAR